MKYIKNNSNYQYLIITITLKPRYYIRMKYIIKEKKISRFTFVN